MELKCFNLSKTLQWCSQARADQLWDFHQALAGNFFPRWRTNSHSLWLSELYDSTFLVSERTIRERSWGTKGNFSVFSHIYKWTFWPERPEEKHGSQHVWNHISKELLKINWVCASNSILLWFFSIINISHTAQRWVKQITLFTTKWNKSRLASEKKPLKFVLGVITQRSHIVTRRVLRPTPKILHVYVRVSGRERTDPSFRLPLDSITAASWTVWWLHSHDCHKRYLLNFNWRPLKRLAETLLSGSGTHSEAAAGTSH